MKSVSFSFLPAVYTLHSEGNHSVTEAQKYIPGAVYTLHSEGNHRYLRNLVFSCLTVYTLMLRYLPSGLRPQLDAQQRTHKETITYSQHLLINILCFFDGNAIELCLICYFPLQREIGPVP